MTSLLQGFPFGDFHLEDVMLPEDDDMGIPSEDDEDLEEEVTTETGFGCVVGERAHSSPFAPGAPHLLSACLKHCCQNC